METLTPKECRVAFDVIQKFAMDLAVSFDLDFSLDRIDRELFWKITDFAVKVERINVDVDAERFRALLVDYLKLYAQAVDENRSDVGVERGG